MSEIHDRKDQDYAMYDAMSTEALEELLRLDCEASTDNTDTEALLYIMDLLAKRSKQKTGKTAQESWEFFQRNYAVDDSKEESDFKPWLRRVIAAAAVIVLLISIPIAAQALSWEDIWNAVAKWAKETFSFVSDADAELTEPDENLEIGQKSLKDLLTTEINVDAMLPTYIPEGYVFKEIITDETPVQRVYIAHYVNENKLLTIAVRSYLDSDMELTEIDNEPLETYKKDGTDYYIFENDERIKAVWKKDAYQCYISGLLDIEEIKWMIDSIEKG